MRQRLRLRREENNLSNSMSCVGTGKQSVFNIFSRGVLNIGLLLETRACWKRKRKIQSWQSIGIENKEKKNIDKATPYTGMLIPSSALHLERRVLHLGPLPHPKDNPTQCVQLPTETLCRGGLSELEAMPLVLCGLQFHIVEDIQLHPLLTV